tara:strand:- start:308 stop:808 length:501 start_codon:yes stop_codon:yes gene_type:complete
MIKNISIILTLVLLVSCGGKPPPKASGGTYSKTTISEGNGKIIIYRDANWLTADKFATVILSGYAVGCLQHKNYVETIVEPGEHGITIGYGDCGPWGFEPIGINVKVAEGETKYIKMQLKEFGSAGIITPWFFSYNNEVNLSEVSESEAMSVLVNLKRFLASDLNN